MLSEWKVLFERKELELRLRFGPPFHSGNPFGRNKGVLLPVWPLPGIQRGLVAVPGGMTKYRQKHNEADVCGRYTDQY